VRGRLRALEAGAVEDARESEFEVAAGSTNLIACK